MLRSRILAPVLLLAAGTLGFAAMLPATQEPIPPTAHHQRLMDGVGMWEGTIAMMVPGFDSTPQKATEKVEAFGSYWTNTHFQCEFMGQPYHGRGSFGFDPKSGKHLGTWIDTMSPHLSVMEGEFDEGTKTLTMHWDAPDMTGEIRPHRSVTVYKGDSPDTMSYTMSFFVGEGEGMKTMEIKMAKKSGAVEAGSGR
ncbi:MAG: DUF1579 family protein [Planctomycetota bacterium]